MSERIPKFFSDAIQSYTDELVTKIATRFSLNEGEVRECIFDTKGVASVKKVDVPKGELWMVTDYDNGPLLIGNTFPHKAKLHKDGKYRAVTEFGPGWQLTKGYTVEKVEKLLGVKPKAKTSKSLSQTEKKPDATKGSDDGDESGDDRAKAPAKRIDLRSKKEESDSLKSESSASKSESKSEKKPSKEESSDDDSSDESSEDEEVVVKKNAWGNNEAEELDVVVLNLDIDGVKQPVAIGSQNKKSKEKGVASVVPLTKAKKAKCKKLDVKVLDKAVLKKIRATNKEQASSLEHLVDE